MMCIQVQHGVMLTADRSVVIRYSKRYHKLIHLHHLCQDTSSNPFPGPTWHLGCCRAAASFSLPAWYAFSTQPETPPSCPEKDGMVRPVADTVTCMPAANASFVAVAIMRQVSPDWIELQFYNTAGTVANNRSSGALIHVARGDTSIFFCHHLVSWTSMTMSSSLCSPTAQTDSTHQSGEVPRRYCLQSSMVLHCSHRERQTRAHKRDHR